eukprot:scaffold788_cov56-Attheya_sp.AAC.5
MTRMLVNAVFLLVLGLVFSEVQSFSPIHKARVTTRSTHAVSNAFHLHHVSTELCAQKPPDEDRISQKRRKQLGLNDDEDEYDLDFALRNNTDPLITKVIAGSLILVIFALLVAGVIVPSLTDYGEGVCSPIQSAGRC